MDALNGFLTNPWVRLVSYLLGVALGLVALALPSGSIERKVVEAISALLLGKTALLHVGDALGARKSGLSAPAAPAAPPARLPQQESTDSDVPPIEVEDVPDDPADRFRSPRDGGG